MAVVPSDGHRWRLRAAAAVATVATLGLGLPAQAAPPEGQILAAGGPTAVTDSYIVVFQDPALTPGSVSSKAGTLAGRHRGKVARTYQNALRGFAVRMSERDAKRLAADPSVRYVQQNHTVSINTRDPERSRGGRQTPTPSWGLDRIDQRTWNADNSLSTPNNGWGVTAYIIDSGIRLSHADFVGRAVSGFDAIDGGSADDGNGHGTHVAGTVGGRAYGVAKAVNLVAVRVLNNQGSGTLEQVLAGIDWVTGDHQPGEPAVANMSLGGAFNQAINDAVTASIADGVTYVVAGGNESSNACGRSPASTPAAITVGATDRNDWRAWYSNTGTCLDLFAPGSGITSAWHTSDTDTNTIDGTSMASPHVAGAAALILNRYPDYTPAQVRDKLVADATPNVVWDAGTGSPNRLLYLDVAAAGPVPPPVKRRPPGQ